MKSHSFKAHEWACSRPELHKVVAEYLIEFGRNQDVADRALATHFLHLKFHLMKGSIQEHHIRYIRTIAVEIGGMPHEYIRV